VFLNVAFGVLNSIKLAYEHLQSPKKIFSLASLAMSGGEEKAGERRAQERETYSSPASPDLLFTI
jgi:predicted outer membrane lipoprotein